MMQHFLRSAGNAVATMAYNNCFVANEKLLLSILPKCLCNDVVSIIADFIFTTYWEEVADESDEGQMCDYDGCSYCSYYAYNEIYDDHVIIYSTMFNQKHGKCNRFYKTGETRSKSHYINGQLEHSIVWYKNGDIFSSQ